MSTNKMDAIEKQIMALRDQIQKSQAQIEKLKKEWLTANPGGDLPPENLDFTLDDARDRPNTGRPEQQQTTQQQHQQQQQAAPAKRAPGAANAPGAAITTADLTKPLKKVDRKEEKKDTPPVGKPQWQIDLEKKRQQQQQQKDTTPKGPQPKRPG